MTDKVNRQMRIWWMEELKAITAREMMKEERRQDREREKNLKKLGDYRNYNDIHEAYGVGAITEKQFDILAAILEKSQPEPDDLYRAKMDLLAELYSEQKKILEGFKEQ